ncbi:hypothetical protein OEIGOIKO_02050 [Streptomyces chrestomyceticus JCM 4735]|uniref:Uncharacterized protein n=1 Tax=Streptomyces chrestomyceticus JCM 4735 TaxID=1306181 RepID=A0A7U9KS07_9ACTN|nr:hypothetical protein [Streptomyces chrestomyceticus]GCD34320.1 hypothetical protein OEIGOIKO_02050 [Streptomyces chrestomyceticus JCM 4735]
MDNKSDTDTKNKEKRLDLSVPQVAGSALAAAVAAFLAGQLGVYGTIIGAGVVSVVATTGGSIFQHLFRRTGEQLKEAATVGTRPKPRRSSGSRRTPGAGSGTGMVLPTFDRQGAEDEITSVAAKDEGRAGDADRTQLLPQAGDPDGDRTRLLPQADPARASGADAGATDKTQMVPRLDDRTMALGQARPGHPPAGATAVPQRADEVSTATYGTRLRGWKRPALAALAIFVLSMGAVTCVEMVTGKDASGSPGTSVGNFFGSSGHKSEPKTPPATDQPSPGTSHGDGSTGSTPSPGVSSSTGTGTGTGDGGTGSTGKPSTPTPSPDASRSGKPTPPPSPQPSKSGGGTGGDTGKGGDDSGGDSGDRNKQEPGGQQAPDPKSS